MYSVEILEPYKIVPVGPAFEMPEFSVIVGKNGSGKTHFLESLVNRQCSKLLKNGNNLEVYNYISFGNMFPSVDAVFNSNQLRNLSDELWGSIESYQIRFQKMNKSEELIKEYDFLKNQKPFRASYESEYALEILRMANKDGVRIKELSREKAEAYVDILGSYNRSNFFGANLSKIFKTYSIRIRENDFKNYLHSTGGNSESGLTATEFESKYGPKPWEVVNTILGNMGLAFQAIPPKDTDPSGEYRLKFTDSISGTHLFEADLSTGERALLSLGLAMFSADRSKAKPQIIFLDEPDAPLHPEFSALLIRTLQEELVGKAKIPVIMTTHSPSTIAACPEGAIFEMDRKSGRPQKVSREYALDLLSSGIPHLRVSTEARRQVFVESKYDVDFFTRIFNALNNSQNFGFEPVFLEPHTGTTNCEDVKNIVQSLMDSGSDLVRGVIDWDGKSQENGNIFVLGECGRYAIENYILDPLFIALSLVNQDKKKLSDLGLEKDVRYSNIVNELTPEDAQIIADSILTLAGIAIQNTVSCLLLNGWDAKRPKEFLEMRGHDWEALLIEKIPELQAMIKGRKEEDKLKKPVLGVIEDFPQFLPKEVLTTLQKLK